MNHLSEDQLAMHFYQEDADESQVVAEHLAHCDSCRSAFEQLSAVLHSVEMPVPERGPDYEAGVWHNLRAQLPEKTSTAPWWALFSNRWAALGAVAALVLVAFFLGRVSQPVQAPVAGNAPSAPPVVAQAPADQPPVQGEATTPKTGSRPVSASPKSTGRDRILLVALGDHLDRSQMVLVELMNADPGQSLDISSQQRLAEDLVSANRLYRQTAARAKETGVVNLLDELERVLVDIAHEPSKISGPELQNIRERIEAQGIVFKVRVVGSQVKQRRQQQRETGKTQKVQRG